MTWTADQPDRRCASDKVSWKAYTDAIFDEHRAQVQAALVAHDVRVVASKESATERVEALRREFVTILNSGMEHIDSMFTENRRATDIAERERAAAALALRSEQQRAQDVAESEREKAAQALAVNLAQSIREGDERLREHIHNQVEQINAALSAVESRAQLRHDSHRTQMDDRFAYTEQAVAKAEAANEKRFSAVNAFREQLSDQATQFLPREVAEAQFAEVRKQIAANTQRLDVGQGTTQGGQASIAQVMAIITIIITLGAILVGAYT